MSLWPWNVNFTTASPCPQHLRWDRKARKELGTSFPPGRWNSENSFFLGQASLRKRELWCISEGSFYLPPAGSMKGFFCNIHCEDPVELLEVKLTALNAFSHPQSFRFSYLCTSSYGFCLWVSVSIPVCCDSQFLQFWKQWFDLWPYFSDGSKKSWYFQFVQLFTCWNGIMTTYMLYQKSEAYCAVLKLGLIDILAYILSLCILFFDINVNYIYFKFQIPTACCLCIETL